MLKNMYIFVLNWLNSEDPVWQAASLPEILRTVGPGPAGLQPGPASHQAPALALAPLGVPVEILLLFTRGFALRIIIKLFLLKPQDLFALFTVRFIMK